MRRHTREGELVIDHRDSPGTVAVTAGELYESATIVCAHCGVTVVLNPQRTRARGYCAKCDHYVCDSPVCNRDCTPQVKAFDVIRDVVERTGHLPDAATLARLLPSVFGQQGR